MKQIYFIILVFSISKAFGQDIVLFNNGDKVEAKVKEISDDEISYLRFDNLEGPIFKQNINSIKEIIFENGTSLSFSDKKNVSALTKEETKAIIVKIINDFAYERDGDKAYQASFEGDFLKLSRKNIETNEISEKFRLFDFTAKCDFHNLSERGNNICYLNVYVPRVLYGESRNGIKLVILIKGHENGQLLLDALKKYNDFFQKD